MAPGGRDERREPRYRVNLKIRFASAVEFVTEYAENLSSNGLFVRAGGNLKAMDEFGVELTLPGLGTFSIGLKVAHVLTPDVAARFGKPPGAGCEIIAGPPGFKEALKAYLGRLGRRRDSVVWCHDDEPRAYFESMGYLARAMPGVGELVAELARSAKPVVAIVVPRDGERIFKHALGAAGEDGLVRVAETEAELDALLIELDGQL